MTPFADIVLLSFNSATAIVIQIILAIVFLNEVFICKYDLPALALIISGSICIILTARPDQNMSTEAILTRKGEGELTSGIYSHYLLQLS